MPDVRELIQYFKEDDPVLRANTYAFIINLGSAVMPFLVEALDDENPQIRDYAVMILGDLGDASVVPAIFQKIEENSVCQHTAFKSVKNILTRYPGYNWDSLIPILVGYLKEHDLFRPHDAAEVISKIGKPAVPALVEALKDNDRDVRIRAAKALGEIGDASATDALIDCLKHDKDRGVRTNAVISLGHIGDRSAVPALTGILDHNNLTLRSNAAYALVQIAGISAVPAVIHLLDDKDTDTRGRVAKAIADVGKSAIPALVDFLKQCNGKGLLNAMETLVNIETKEPGSVNLSDVREALKEFVRRMKDRKSAESKATEYYMELLKRVSQGKEGIEMPGEMIQASSRPPKGRIFRGRTVHV